MALTFIKRISLDAGVVTPVFTNTSVQRNMLFLTVGASSDESRLFYYLKAYFEQTIAGKVELAVYRDLGVYNRLQFYDNSDLDPLALYMPLTAPIRGFLDVDVYYF